MDNKKKTTDIILGHTHLGICIDVILVYTFLRLFFYCVR